VIKGLVAIAILAAIVLFAWAVETLLDRRQTWAARFWLSLIIAGLVALVLALVAHFGSAHAHDEGQWTTTDQQQRHWYQALMQPDNPQMSCCGEADAYWCDDYYSRGGKAYCRITDDRPDEPRQRPHIDIGTEVEIPDVKLKWDRSNPTGHGVVFLSRGLYVYCYVQPGGV
jgi:4-amino-4-deoxy-L-arabinose transferase-like glycosyltransferase